jgi:hypothetical protein
MRRIEPFLYRCAELDKLDAIRRVVGTIMDNLLYSPKLFDMAEVLLAQGRHDAALLFYEGVAETEKYQHSERLATCQYRIFTIQVGDDQSRNLKAATLFEPYIERLDEMDQLDALKDLANVYRSLRKWDKVEEMARQMRGKAEVQYSIKHQQKNRKNSEHERKPEGRYLDWVKETDEDTQHWVNLFSQWAEGNTHVNKLLSGDVSVLPDYVEYIAATSIVNENEKLSKLLNVMIAANRYEIDVDDILSRFETNINSFAQTSSDIYPTSNTRLFRMVWLRNGSLLFTSGEIQ